MKNQFIIVSIVFFVLMGSGGNFLRTASAITVDEYKIPTTDSQPFQMVAGADGHLWFTESAGGKIGRIFISGLITEYPLSNPLSRAEWIAAATDGGVWFTVSGTGGTHRIGRMSPGGFFTEYNLPNPFDSPYSLVTGKFGFAWYLVGGKKIGKVSPGGVITEYALPVGNLNVISKLVVDAEGNLLFIQARTQNFPMPAQFYLGRLTFEGVFSEVLLGELSQFNITDFGVAPDGTLWCSTISTARGSEAQNGFRRLNADGTFSETFLATRSLAPLRFVNRRDGSFWFLATVGAATAVGKISVDGGLAHYETGGTPRYTSLVRGPDDNLWFLDSAHNILARLTPDRATGLFVTRSSSYVSGAMAADSMATIFGSALASGTDSASTIPLPYSLAAATVTIRDSKEVERLAPLFFVSPNQINFLVPSEVAPGNAIVTVRDATRQWLTFGTMVIDSVAPGIFSADASGTGLAAAFVYRIRANGSESYEPVVQVDSTGKLVAVPIDFGAADDQVFLALFGSGVRSRSDISKVTAICEAATLPVIYAGAQGGFAGLDQINLQLPRTLTGRGTQTIAVSVDGRTANRIMVSFK